MQKTILTIVLATLCLIYTTKAQFYQPSEKSIKVGEAFPDSFYKITHQAINTRTHQPITIQLQQYKNKLIILDFWATWCGPCIRSLINLDSTEKVMKSNDFIVIPVTYQDPKTASTAFNKYQWDFASIVNDTTLGQIFPTSSIPFQIWIKDGKLLANPQARYATVSNIQKAIAGIKTNMPATKQQADSSKPLWQYGKQLSYSASIAPGYPEYAQQRLIFNQTDSLSALFCFNVPIVEGMFYSAFETSISKYADPEEGSGFVLEVSDSLRNVLQGLQPANSKPAYYSYNLRINKKITKNEALKIMQQDLNNYFGTLYGIEAVVEIRPRKMAILDLASDRLSVEKLLKTAGDSYINNTRGGTIVLRNAGFNSILSAISKVRIAPKTVFLNRTGFDNSFKIDFQLPYSLKEDFEGARKHFAAYGLSLTMHEVEQSILVIREKKQAILKNANH